MSTREKVQIILIIVFILSMFGGFGIKILDINTNGVNWSAFLLALALISFIVGWINVQEINKEYERKKAEKESK
jgi:uncharacterized membrane protein